MKFVKALCGCACGSLGLLLLAGASPLPDHPAGESAAPLAAATPADHPDAAAPQPAVPPNPIPPGAIAPPAPPATAGVDTCPADQACVDGYLWSLYTRTPKLDTVSVPEHKTVTVTRKGKTKTITKTENKVVGEDFGWKDPKAAELSGKSLMDYVIGGMDPGFRGTLYHALRALDDAGFQPGIMCAFRDDYRQSIATGLKAQNDRSFHGGSFRGGYGHGLAADIVSVKGDARIDRLAASSAMWEYIDGHEGELGIGRPYGDRDPPHVGPIDGEEYATHRRKPTLQAGNANRNKAAARNAKQTDAKTDAKSGPKTGAKAGAKTGTRTELKGGSKTGNKTAGASRKTAAAKTAAKSAAKTAAETAAASKTAGSSGRDTRPGDDRKGGLAVRNVSGREPVTPARVRAKLRTRAI